MNKTYELCEKNTLALFERHGKAFFARDFDAIVADFDEDGVFVLNGKVFKGKEKIKKVFEYATNIFDNCGTQKDFEAPLFLNEVIYLKWRFIPKDKTEALLGTDTIVVLNGKIHCQTVTSDTFDLFPMKE